MDDGDGERGEGEERRTGTENENLRFAFIPSSLCFFIPLFPFSALCLLPFAFSL
jgi:hypothetical protein